MKTYYHVIFWISLVICLLPTNTFSAISSFSLIIVLALQFLWFFGLGAIIAEDIVKKEIPVKIIFLPVIAIIIAINAKYFFGFDNPVFTFQWCFITFVTTAIVASIFITIGLLFKLLIKKIFRKKPPV